MITIFLITTEGCEGCRIQDNIINKAIADFSAHNPESIVYRRSDVKAPEVKQFISHYHHYVHDFPTTFILDNDDYIVACIEGTYPKDKLLNILNKIV